MQLTKRKLRQLADKLRLDPRKGETIETLFERCLKRASSLAHLMEATEESDTDRTDWEWAKD